MQVISIDKATAEKFVLNKHYSRRASIFWAAYGLVEDGCITGVCVYGQPSPSIQKHAFKERDFQLYELARLVIQSKAKNAASFLVANSLKRLKQPSAVISYADSEQSHCGIIYQAANFIYTGATVAHDSMYLINGVLTHSMSLRDKGITNPKQWAKENNIQTFKPFPKHRYFFLNGDKREKKRMLESLVYPIIKEYPKCDQKRYNDGPQINQQINGESKSCKSCSNNEVGFCKHYQSAIPEQYLIGICENYK